MTPITDDTLNEASRWDEEQRKLVHAIEAAVDSSTRDDMLATYAQVFGPWANRPGPATDKGGRQWPG